MLVWNEIKISATEFTAYRLECSQGMAEVSSVMHLKDAGNIELDMLRNRFSRKDGDIPKPLFNPQFNVREFGSDEEEGKT